MGTKKMLAKVIGLKDEYLSKHHSGVKKYAEKLIIILNIDIADTVVTAASFHDIGKIGIPDEILFKPDKLSSFEWEFMKQHPVSGAQLIARGNGEMKMNGKLNEVVKAIRHHHERWNGGGYPDGLKGEEISLAARIIAVADAYDAMTTDRPYKKAMTKNEAAKEIIRNSGKQFDPYVADMFVNKVLNI